MRRVLMAALLLGVVVVAPRALAGAACEADAEGHVGVVVVVDFADIDDGPSEPSIACVSVPEGDTGSDVLEARARQLGTPPPRYESSGLLCAIDGLPEEGCGEQVGDSFRYWAYWLGDAEGWGHAEAGPGFRDAASDTTEGWRFTEGSGTPSDPPPSAPADPEEAAAEVNADTAVSDRRASDDSSSIVGALVAAGAVALLLVAGFVVSRRRRRGS